METDHLILRETVLRTVTVPEQEANLKYLEQLAIEHAAEADASAAAASAAKSVAEAARDDAGASQTASAQSKSDSAASASQAVAARQAAESARDAATGASTAAGGSASSALSSKNAAAASETSAAASAGAAATSAAAAAAANAAIANGSAPDANALGDADIFPLSRGAGVIKTTLRKIADYALAALGITNDITKGTALIVHLPDGANAVAFQLRKWLLDFPNAKNWNLVGDGPTGGASPAGATDNTARLAYAIAQVPAGTTLTFVGNIYLAGRIPMRTRVNVRIKGTVTFGSIGIGFDFSSVNNARLHIDSLYGDGTSNSSGVVISDGNDNRIYIDALYNFANKGVVVGGNSQRNSIYLRYATGCWGVYGAAVALTGSGVTNNDIQVCYGYQNRIAITINGSHGNRIKDSVLEYNQQAGLAIDGIVTGGNDGGCRNQISNLRCNYNGTTTTAYGGIYLGNGSRDNEFINTICRYNYGAGVRATGGVGYEVSGNKFSNLMVQYNQLGGSMFSNAPNTYLSNFDSQYNSGAPGLQWFISDGSFAVGARVSNNAGQTGVLIQSANCKISSGEAKGNATGINVAAGGSAVYSGNVISGVDLTGNATAAATIANGSAKLQNCAGVGTENFGSTNIKDGSVISHGMYGTPQCAQFDAADPTHVARVSSLNGSTATLSLKDSAGNPVTANETVRYNFKFNFGV